MYHMRTLRSICLRVYCQYLFIEKEEEEEQPINRSVDSFQYSVHRSCAFNIYGFVDDVFYSLYSSLFLHVRSINIYRLYYTDDRRSQLHRLLTIRISHRIKSLLFTIHRSMAYVRILVRMFSMLIYDKFVM
jgi:hypothetical protein